MVMNMTELKKIIQVSSVVMGNIVSAKMLPARGNSSLSEGSPLKTQVAILIAWLVKARPVNER